MAPTGARWFHSPAEVLDVLEIRTGDGELIVDVGEACSFGRGLDVVDLVLTDDPRVHRHAGTVVAEDDGWTLHNDGRWLHLRVSSLAGRGHHVLEPGASVRVPWPDARVDIVVGAATVGFEVHHLGAPLHRHRPLAVDPGDSATISPARIGRGSGAFRALLALCAPRLSDSASEDLPTNAEIAWRLNRCGIEPGHVTAKAVERRLDYCRRRLGLDDEVVDSRIGLDHRALRRQLVDAAIMTGVVRAEDVSMLGGGGSA